MSWIPLYLSNETTAVSVSFDHRPHGKERRRGLRPTRALLNSRSSRTHGGGSAHQGALSKLRGLEAQAARLLHLHPLPEPRASSRCPSSSHASKPHPDWDWRADLGRGPDCNASRDVSSRHLLDLIFEAAHKRAMPCLRGLEEQGTPLLSLCRVAHESASPACPAAKQ